LYNLPTVFLINEIEPSAEFRVHCGLSVTKGYFAQVESVKLLEDKLRPAIELAIARTVLANERSLLAFVRTALGCF
jgi:hypothetical protein